MKVSEALGFFLRYVRNPASIGAVCPSSRFLARKMAAPARGVLRENCVVAELGSGTGAITRYLLSELPIAPENLYCVEFDKASFAVLKNKFARARVFNDSAENLGGILGADAGRLACVVSCLPLLSLPEKCVENILGEAERLLPPGGLFIQFTYNLFSPSAQKFLPNMDHVGKDFTLLNIPPARVDVFRKR